MYNELREQEAKNLVSYGKYVYDNSYDNENGSYRNSLIEYFNTYFWIEKHNGETDFVGRAVHFYHKDFEVKINMIDNFIEIKKLSTRIVRPISYFYAEDSFKDGYIIKYQKNMLRTSYFQKLIIHILENKEIIEMLWLKWL